MPVSTTATAPPCETRRASPDEIVVSYGVRSEQLIHEKAGNHHSLIIMPERPSEAQFDWQDKEDGNSGILTIRGQNVVFIHKYVDYSIHWKQKAVLIGFHIETDLSHEREMLIKSLAKVAHKPLWHLVRYDCYIMDTIEIFIELSRDLRRPYSSAYLEHLGSALSFHLLDGLSRKRTPAPPPTMDEERFNRILDYIDKNIHRRIEIPELASVACLSGTHFSRLLKNTTGMTPSDFLSYRRIRHAQTLMRITDKTMAEIAADVGFCDQAHFNRTFQHYCRCSPADYARKVRLL